MLFICPQMLFIGSNSFLRDRLYCRCSVSRQLPLLGQKRKILHLNCQHVKVTSFLKKQAPFQTCSPKQTSLRIQRAQSFWCFCAITTRWSSPCPNLIWPPFPRSCLHHPSYRLCDFTSEAFASSGPSKTLFPLTNSTLTSSSLGDCTAPCVFQFFHTQWSSKRVLTNLQSTHMYIVCFLTIKINRVARDGNFYFRKTSLCTGFGACNCLFESRCCF